MPKTPQMLTTPPPSQAPALPPQFPQPARNQQPIYSDHRCAYSISAIAPCHKAVLICPPPPQRPREDVRSDPVSLSTKLSPRLSAPPPLQTCRLPRDLQPCRSESKPCPVHKMTSPS
ncbi:hypothetical protein M0R45_035722 [Rubus argutus]|uniref:Uncharacterized protein n=1 Tax=Rubus argutus TaxID=59490 RepID=A0AAW1VVH2_RUBAR